MYSTKYSIKEISSLVNTKPFVDKLINLYNNDFKTAEEASCRIKEMAIMFEKVSSSKEVYIFSASGRIELSGNHTDHNNGKVLAASINLDKLALVSKRGDNKIVVYTDTINNFDTVDITNLEIVQSEHHSSSALIRGVCAGFKNRGKKTGGADIFLSNRVLMGSGLSSSASFEALVGEILNTLYNDGEISKVDIAIIGQYAENEYFGKPCGLMDQVACSVGGIVSIDFKNHKEPLIEKVEYDFEDNGYALMVVDAKGDHSSLTPEYAAIRNEMFSVASFFNKTFLRDITKDDITKNISSLRKSVGDRAVMRAMHYLNENDRVVSQVNAIKNNNIKEYIRLMNESGDSSFMYLQNCYSITSTKDMGVAIALMMTKDFLKGSSGGVRINGGGFAGTIEALIPLNMVYDYLSFMNSIFSEGSAKKLRIRIKEVTSI